MNLKKSKGTASSGNERGLQDIHKNMGMEDMKRAMAGMDDGGKKGKHDKKHDKHDKTSGGTASSGIERGFMEDHMK